MSTPILVTSPRITPDSIALMQAAQESGRQTVRLPNYHPTDDLKTGRVALYSEPLFAMIVSSKLNHVLIEPTYDWLTTLPQDYLKREVRYGQLADARHMTAPTFVKNADGLKGFDARVYASSADLPPPDFYPDELPVLMAEPVTWLVEYRCFVLERQITILSIYLKAGELAKNADGSWVNNPDEQDDARVFCQMILDDSSVPVPPTCVIDVGIIENRGWAIIEANPAYGSGIYGCDPLAVLPVVERATVPQAQVIPDDQPWLRAYELDED